MNRPPAVGSLDDRINIEGSKNAERLLRTQPNKRFDPTGWSLAIIENLSLAQLFPGGSIAALDGYFLSRVVLNETVNCAHSIGRQRL